jgi:hypothetical protein
LKYQIATMKYLKTRLLYFLLIFFSVNIATAQRPGKGQKVQGFIITNKSDTIHGIIEVEDYILAETRVKFTKRRGKGYTKTKTYKAKDLQGYAVKIPVNNNSNQIIEKWIPYVSRDVKEAPKPFTSKTVFLERKEMGIFNLYLYHVQANTEARNNLYFILENANTKSQVEVTKENFDEIYSNLLDNCEGIRSRIGRADLSYFNFDKIIYLYNRCTAEATPNAH